MLVEEVGRVVEVVVGGVEEERGAAAASGLRPPPLVEVWMSPVAAASLFVKDEMAQPAQELSCCGVDMRGMPAPADPATEVGGKTVSGMVVWCLRMRAT